VLVLGATIFDTTLGRFREAGEDCYLATPGQRSCCAPDGEWLKLRQRGARTCGAIPGRSPFWSATYPTDGRFSGDAVIRDDLEDQLLERAHTKSKREIRTNINADGASVRRVPAERLPGHMDRLY